MAEVTPSSPHRKNGNGNYRGRERELVSDMKHWLADLDAAEALRREQLRHLAELRRQVYRQAKARGVTPAMLRAARSLLSG